MFFLLFTPRSIIIRLYSETAKIWSENIYIFLVELVENRLLATLFLLVFTYDTFFSLPSQNFELKDYQRKTTTNLLVVTCNFLVKKKKRNP